MSQEILVDDYTFNGVMLPPAAASVLAGPFASKITKTAGSPSVSGVSGGGIALALDNTNEAQNVCLYQGDVLPYSIDSLVQVDIWATLTASLAAAVSGAFGLATARNDAIDSIAERALFQFSGNNNINIDAADGVNSFTGKATGLTLAATMAKFTMSFKEGIQTLAGALSKGGKANTIFSMENSRGQLRRVVPNVQVDLSNYTGNLQLFAQIQKTANAAVGTLKIRRMRVFYRLGPNP